MQYGLICGGYTEERTLYVEFFGASMKGIRQYQLNPVEQVGFKVKSITFKSMNFLFL